MLLCRIGWHQAIGVTIGGFIRCYTCGRNRYPDTTWRRELPPDLRSDEEKNADELRRVLEDLTTALWNEGQLLNTPERAAAMVALGYRREGVYWVKP